MTRTTRVLRSTSITALAIVIAAGSAACAARGPRNQARVGALAVGDLVIAVSQAERSMYQTKVYDPPAHEKLDAAIAKALFAARGYERAVKAWPTDTPAPEAVDKAKAGLLAALSDVEQVIPAVAAARDPLMRALAAVRAALASPGAELLHGVTPQHAQLPPGELMAFLALMNLFGSLLQSGRTTVARLKDVLRKEGASDAELDALDDRLTAEIERREAERS